ncbi:hypothetical protein VUR80DRAFT_2164 [Thermomyces stellatus]
MPSGDRSTCRRPAEGSGRPRLARDGPRNSVVIPQGLGRPAAIVIRASLSPYAPIWTPSRPPLAHQHQKKARKATHGPFLEFSDVGALSFLSCGLAHAGCQPLSQSSFLHISLAAFVDYECHGGRWRRVQAIPIGPNHSRLVLLRQRLIRDSLMSLVLVVCKSPLLAHLLPSSLCSVLMLPISTQGISSSSCTVSFDASPISHKS